MRARSTQVRAERERLRARAARAASVVRASGRATRTSCWSDFADPDDALAARARREPADPRRARAAGLPRSLRISIGTPEQNDRLLGALR